MQEENPQTHSFVFSEAMVSLVKAANETATFFEGLAGTEGKAFISEAVIHLSTVYASVLKIGETEPVLDFTGEPTVTEQEWSGIFQRIAQILGGHNEILRPAEEDEFDRAELVIHTISEDLSDVYQELRDFTSLFSRGIEEIMNDAAWELKERFADHWGKKLLRALTALHDLYVAGIDPTAE
ncbi:MAG: DUF5063 domain-containing protein [Bacteroidota bacterium]